MKKITLNASAKVKLTIWISNHKEECATLTAEQLVVKAKTDLGFDISKSSINSFRNNVHPEMKVVKVEKFVKLTLPMVVEEMGKLNEQISRLAKTVEFIKSELNIAEVA